MGAAQSLSTFDELYAAIAALPDGQHGEILGPGWVRTMSRPGGPHARAAKRLLRALGRADVDERGAWWIDREREILFPGGKLFVPDLAGWRVGDGDLAFVDENPVSRLPDWSCEILSRSTQRADRVVKLPTYAEAGVGHVWVVDVEAATIEVFAAHDGRPLLVATARAEEERLLPPFELPIRTADLLAIRARILPP